MVEENLPRTGQLPLTNSLVTLKRVARRISKELKRLDPESKLARDIECLVERLPSSREVLRPACTASRKQIYLRVERMHNELLAKLVVASRDLLEAQQAELPRN